MKGIFWIRSCEHKLRYGFQKMSYGTYGAGGTTNWSIESGKVSKMTKIMIKHGCIVDGIGFQIGDSVIWFSGPGGIISEITLGSNEYITQISGTEGRYDYSRERHITSLNIHTNVCPHGYGPFGTAEHVSDKSSFITPYVEGNAIVGFCGHFGNFLDSIAVSMKPKMSYGTYGACDPTNWSIESGQVSKITKIMIKHGSIIDGIGFQIADTVICFCGPGGVVSEITLGSNEYITQISGSEGRYDRSKERHITPLKIHTNACPHGYGPFGTADHVSNKSSFITPFIEGNAIVGFCGHFGKFLNSIAVSLKPVISYYRDDNELVFPNKDVEELLE